MGEIIFSVISAIALGVMAVIDIKCRKLTIKQMIVFAAVIVPLSAFLREVSGYERAGGVLVGILMAGLSFATRGGIGMGDAILLCVTGIGFGFSFNLSLTFIGIVMAGVMCGVLLAMKKVGRKDSVPLVPFLFAGYVVTEVLRLQGKVI